MGISRNNKRLLISVTIAALVGSFIIIWIFHFSNQPPGFTGAPTQVQYGITLKNKTGTLTGNGKLYVFAPVSETAFQSCKTIDASHPFKTEKDELGNQVLVFSVDNLPPFATRPIRIRAEINHYSFPRKTGDTNQTVYLQPEPYIESAHPDIADLASRLAEADPGQTAKKIYNWVSSRIRDSGYTKENFGALHALKTGRGDCTESMYLFIALCRANRIPARGIGGYLCTGNSVLAPGDYHNWAEVYLDGTWVLADCQKKVFAGQHREYIAMNIVSRHAAPVMKGYPRFRYQGSGVNVRLNR